MDEEQSVPHKRSRLLTVIVVAVVAAGVGAAAFVIVRNATRVTPLKSELGTVEPPDPYLSIFVKVTMRHTAKLDYTLDRYRKRVQTPTPAQDSLLQAVDSGFTSVRQLVAEIDTLRKHRKPEQDKAKKTVNLAYRSVYRAVKRFIKTLTQEEAPLPESLDAELRDLLGE